MNNVMPTKEDRLNIRIRPDIKEDLRITADLRGQSVSGLIHSLVVKAIREEKDREPRAFQKQTKTATGVIDSSINLDEIIEDKREIAAANQDEIPSASKGKRKIIN